MMEFVLVVIVILSLAPSTIGQDEEICTPCGCFDNSPPFDDFFPLPEPPGTGPGEQDILFRLYSRDDQDQYTEFRFDDGIPEEFDPDQRTVFICHGWESPPLTSVKEAYRNSYDQLNYNTIVMDWDGGRRLRYWLSAANARVAGACAAVLAERMVEELGASWDDMMCVGHSLGSQFCGMMGKASEGKMGRVTGLDPAGPWFMSDDPAGRIDASDAQFVDILHTSAGNLSLGIGHRGIGDVDFFPNKGYGMPSCDPDDIDYCDHRQCVPFFRYSLLEPDCTFLSRPCDSEQDADEGLCEECEEGVDCQRMGHYAEDMPGRGNFYLRTTAGAPYCEEVDEYP